MTEKKIYSLYEVSKSIEKTISNRYSSSFWLKTEMNKLNHYSHSGHCFPELVEKKEGVVITQMKSFLWKSDYYRINNKFISILKEPLKDGINILCLVEVNYDIKYGISLKIIDIDPSYSLGELEKEKQKTIYKLKSLNLFDKQKQITFPTLPKRIAIISVETSKGYADFIKILHQNPNNFVYEHQLFPSILQGEKATKSIVKQLKNIEKIANNFDLVAIIRGGGGEVGLASFNDFNLCKEISSFKLPIITGIGHATNITVTEQIANYNAITPTELASFLIQKYDDLFNILEKNIEKISLLVKQHILLNKEKIESLSNRTIQKSKLTLLLNENNLNLFTVKLKNSIDTSFQQEKTKLNIKELFIKHNNPIKVLKKGYTITTKNGEIIKNDNIHQNDIIESLFNDKIIISKIEKIKYHE